MNPDIHNIHLIATYKLFDIIFHLLVYRLFLHYFYSTLFVFTCTILSVLLCCTVGGACDLRFPCTYLHCSYVHMTRKALNPCNTLFVVFTLGEIPDAAFIHAARKRRQQAREQGGEPPLVETENPKKRMAQEDQDASDDEDEDEKRIRFSGVKNKTQRQKIAEEIGTVKCSTDCCLIIYCYQLVS